MNLRQRVSLLLSTAVLLLAAACSSASTSQKTMEGFWLDNDNNATTIQAQGDGFVAVTTYYMVSSYSQNSLVSSSYANGVLTWKYCPPAKPCITMKTVSFKDDKLEVTWTNDKGESGTMTLTRTDTGRRS